MATEARYLDVKSNRSFERTYGWAWTLRLAAELATWNDPDGKAWSENLAPLTNSLLARLKDFLPKLASPIRSGVHPNTAFALGEALDYARAVKDTELEKLVVKRSREYYEKDRACPIAYEPSGEDFFSPCLEEADLMRRVLPRDEFAKWLSGFLPGLAADKPFPLSPAVVTDPTDPRLVHLDGVNLTRAWTLNSIGRALPASDPRRRVLERLSGRARAGGDGARFVGELRGRTLARVLRRVPVDRRRVESVDVSDASQERLRLVIPRKAKRPKIVRPSRVTDSPRSKGTGGRSPPYFSAVEERRKSFASTVTVPSRRRLAFFSTSLYSGREKWTL